MMFLFASNTKFKMVQSYFLNGFVDYIAKNTVVRIAAGKWVF